MICKWLDATHVGDCRILLRRMIAEGIRVQAIVTSPPYWGLRDYGVAGQFGLERTWIRHVARMRYVFRLAREVLADDGTLWLNCGDSYASSGGAGWQGKHGARANRTHTQRNLKKRSALDGLKPKDLVGMPWRIALALQADGWYLRSDIIWHKPNPMPESVTDRPTKSHEYVFMFARSERYFFDAEAIKEAATYGAPNSPQSIASPHGQGFTRAAKRVSGWKDGPGSHSAKDHARAGAGLKDSTKFGRGKAWRAEKAEQPRYRNARSVWSIPTEPTSFAHFATFPRELAARCILAGTRPGDVVLDPFMGSGTTAQVATDLGRHFVGCELNPEYAALGDKHRKTTTGMGI